MNKQIILFIISIILSVLSVDAQTITAEVLFETTEGNIRIGLYDETPKHRDNFLKLTRMHVYDSLLFHRVIKGFMIQTGDINSKHARAGQRLGTGDFDYTQEPEFRLPQIYHRRGSVAMAREPDDVNPDMRSSASQFYIVWGKLHSSLQIEQAQERLDTLTRGRVKLTPEMVKTYRFKGGTPHLDGQYTVFGEVTEGLDIVERIQKAETDEYARPFEDIRILRATITKDIPKQAPEPVVKDVPKSKVKSRGRPVNQKK